MVCHCHDNNDKIIQVQAKKRRGQGMVLPSREGDPGIKLKKEILKRGQGMVLPSGEGDPGTKK